MLRRMRLLMFGVIILCTRGSAQYPDGCSIDFGRYIVPFITANDVSLPLYRFPAKTGAPFARFTSKLEEVSLYTHIPKFSLERRGIESVENMGKRIIDLSEASAYALPVLAFSADSLWVQISLDCRIRTNPPSAWLFIGDIRDARLRIASWGEYFHPHTDVVFLCDSLCAFYAYPDTEFRIFRNGSKISPHISRAMEVLSYSNPWMMVRVTPPVADRDTVWIQYLDEHGRPRIWPVEE